MEWDYRLIDPGSRGLGAGGLRDLEAPPAVVLSLVLLPSMGSWDMADMLMQPGSDTCFPSPRFSHLNTCFIAHLLAYPYLSAAECPHLMGPLIGQGNKTPCSGLSIFIPKSQFTEAPLQVPTCHNIFNWTFCSLWWWFACRHTLLYSLLFPPHLNLLF